MDFQALIRARRTIRKFEQKPVSKEQLHRYIDAARLAPSAANMQPLKYVPVSRPALCKKLFPLTRWAGYLSDYAPKEGERPTAYIAVCADLNIRKNGYELDAGAAAENIILSALSDGVGACWMGAIDYQKISELLGLDESVKLLYVIALGYPKESPSTVELEDENVKYFIGEDAALKVPKRSLEEVIIKSL